ncbi:sel1 repeat family protein [Oleiagrimonas sp. C23AA]|uniref:tetratricopeptide repeat protein n=1 Tax=Oleiagrimonas sp. C23AA TaxID=2719047 RepID=UPI00141F567A|nr:sel1 repeat family protein [Oleiagrimonas sp. C23AA]NII09885.1 sel1 repeat family protein [Oleiagrimonas sp. C23AA]
MDVPLNGSICSRLLAGCALALVFSTPPVAASPSATPASPAQVPPPHMTQQVKQLLKAMRRASTRGHPDLYGEFGGMKRLFDGDYQGALKYFRYGARYADKLSQASLGMMYLNGRGVARSPAMACAWMTLAAERGYPPYVEARTRICSALAPAMRAQSNTALASLRPEYGDKVAKRRMTRALLRGRNTLTGSRVGFDAGLKTQELPTSPVDCSKPALTVGALAVPLDGCPGFQLATWQPATYFAARDKSPLPTVDVGPLHEVSSPSSPDHQAVGFG